MKKVNVHLISALIFSVNILLAQPQPKSYHTTFGNLYNAAHGVAGGIVYDTKNPILLSKPYSIFASGLWLGGINREEEMLKTAITTYNTSGYDFVAGPLDLNKNEEERTILGKQYDKIWVVTAAEILQHREDFKDGKIDNPMPNIMAWPAKGNLNFETVNFFKNDYDSQDLAPFKDVNNDGIYTPLQGDFPFITQADEAYQPDEIFWSIFNDHSGHTNSRGRPLYVEIQQTGWTFSCNENPILNNTNFLSFKVLNKGESALDSLFMGYWADFDLGCYNDDLIGCSPTNNTFFTYNNGDFDGDTSHICPGGVATFKGKGVPVSSISFLNQPMYSFMNYNNSSVASPPWWATDPTNFFDCYRFMNAQWKDNIFVTKGGNGYNPNSKDYTKFMFDGNPNDSTSWSMKTINVPRGDRRALGNIYIKSLAPNKSVTLDIALTLHYDKSKTTTAAQIDNMYANFPKLQAAYNQHFISKCVAAKCQNDCVFPGDANNDGRADERDFLTIAQHLNKKGKARNGSIFWEGKTNEDWAEKTNLGINLKHTDCDGNGTIEETTDKAVLFENFLKTHSKFQAKPDVFLHNDEIAFAVKSGLDSLNINSLGSTFAMTLYPNLTDNDAIGYSFELDFDTRFFKSIAMVTKGNFLKIIDRNQIGNIHFASYLTGRQIFSFSLSDEIKNKKKVPTECTELRFKNIQAIRADGSIIPTIGARDIKLCFSQNLLHSKEQEPVLTNLEIYPNPFYESLVIENKNTEMVGYQLFDIQGKALQASQIAAESQVQLTTDFLPKGIYILKIKHREGQFMVKKIVKME